MVLTELLFTLTVNNINKSLDHLLGRIRIQDCCAQDMLTFYLVSKGLRNVKRLRTCSRQPKAYIGRESHKVRLVKPVNGVVAVVNPETVVGSPIKMKSTWPLFGSHPFRYYFYRSDESP